MTNTVGTPPLGLVDVGDGVIIDGVVDGDVVVVQQTHTIRRGDIVVAMIDNETTVKSYYPAPDARVELRPANSDFKSQFYPVEDVSIQGKVVSLQRQY